MPKVENKDENKLRKQIIQAKKLREKVIPKKPDRKKTKKLKRIQTTEKEKKDNNEEMREFLEFCQMVSSMIKESSLNLVRMLNEYQD